MKGRVLVAGFATRHVVQSAARAGYVVCAIDHFTDLDLGWYAKKVTRFEDLDELQARVEHAAASDRFDFFVATSGAETLCVPCPRRGTPPEVAARFMDKLATQEHLATRSVPVPRLLDDGIYPALIKPRSGSGGWRNRVVGNRDEETAWRSQFPDVPMFRQEFVAGDPASVSVLTDGTRVVPIAANLQLLRDDAIAPWGFAGSITPLPASA
ncbi:MAG: ATP-grasp domain-containing protein, partial [Methanomicrobiales archaeon]|nr:ATP-grasp domain-containing protein [Methanomicrobiales archaeon]